MKALLALIKKYLLKEAATLNQINDQPKTKRRKK
jgi:hypothetical protein